MRPATRALVILALSSPSAAQPATISYELSWRAIPSNSTFALFVGDSAEIVLSVRITPGINFPISYTPPPPPGVGTIAGLGSIYFDLIGCSANPGQWTLSGPGFGGTTGSNWGRRSGRGLGPVGAPQSNGDVIGCSAGQFPVPGQTASALTPIVEIWRGKWTPSSYQAANIHRFTIQPIESRLLAHYAPNQYYPALVQSHVASINIPIDPGSPGPCFPQFQQQPQGTIADVGYRATFTAAATASGCPVTFRWRKGCTVLTNGGNISGADTPTLVIDPVTLADAGQYEVLANYLPSSPASLTLYCYANCDRAPFPPLLTINDYMCFLGRFAAGNATANCDRSTIPPLLTVNDYICFTNAYAAGCP